MFFFLKKGRLKITETRKIIAKRNPRKLEGKNEYILMHWWTLKQKNKRIYFLKNLKKNMVLWMGRNKPKLENKIELRKKRNIQLEARDRRYKHKERNFISYSWGSEQMFRERWRKRPRKGGQSSSEEEEGARPCVAHAACLRASSSLNPIWCCICPFRSSSFEVDFHYFQWREDY